MRNSGHSAVLIAAILQNLIKSLNGVEIYCAFTDFPSWDQLLLRETCTDFLFNLNINDMMQNEAQISMEIPLPVHGVRIHVRVDDILTTVFNPFDMVSSLLKIKASSLMIPVDLHTKWTDLRILLRHFKKVLEQDLEIVLVTSNTIVDVSPIVQLGLVELVDKVAYFNPGGPLEPEVFITTTVSVGIPVEELIWGISDHPIIASINYRDLSDLTLWNPNPILFQLIKIQHDGNAISHIKRLHQLGVNGIILMGVVCEQRRNNYLENAITGLPILKRSLRSAASNSKPIIDSRLSVHQELLNGQPDMRRENLSETEYPTIPIRVPYNGTFYSDLSSMSEPVVQTNAESYSNANTFASGYNPVYNGAETTGMNFNPYGGNYGIDSGSYGIVPRPYETKPDFYGINPSSYGGNVGSYGQQYQSNYVQQVSQLFGSTASSSYGASSSIPTPNSVPPSSPYGTMNNNYQTSSYYYQAPHYNAPNGASNSYQAETSSPGYNHQIGPGNYVNQTFFPPNVAPFPHYATVPTINPVLPFPFPASTPFAAPPAYPYYPFPVQSGHPYGKPPGIYGAGFGLMPFGPPSVTHYVPPYRASFVTP